MEGQQFQTGKIVTRRRTQYESSVQFVEELAVKPAEWSLLRVRLEGVGYVAVRGWTSDLSKLTFKNWGDEKSPSTPSEVRWLRDVSLF